MKYIISLSAQAVAMLGRVIASGVVAGPSDTRGEIEKQVGLALRAVKRNRPELTLTAEDVTKERPRPRGKANQGRNGASSTGQGDLLTYGGGRRDRAAGDTKPARRNDPAKVGK